MAPKRWQLDKFTAWLKERAKGLKDERGRTLCAVCRTNKFEITDTWALLKVDPDGRLKQRVPVARPGEEETIQELLASSGDEPTANMAVAFRCRNCGYMMFFDAQKIGLMESQRRAPKG